MGQAHSVVAEPVPLEVVEEARSAVVEQAPKVEVELVRMAAA